MKQRDRLPATGLVILMLILWLGFLVHRAPRFAGSWSPSAPTTTTTASSRKHWITIRSAPSTA